MAAAVLLVLLAAAPAPPTGLRCEGTGAPSLRDAAGNVAVARLGSERAARRDALRRCLAVLGPAPLQAGGTVAEALTADPALRRRVEGALRRLVRRGALRLFADGGVGVEVVLPFHGRIEDVLAAGGR